MHLVAPNLLKGRKGVKLFALYKERVDVCGLCGWEQGMKFPFQLLLCTLFIRQFQRFFFHPRENFLIVVGEGDEVHSSLLIQDHTSRIVQSHHLNPICGLVILCVIPHSWVTLLRGPPFLVYLLRNGI